MPVKTFCAMAAALALAMTLPGLPRAAQVGEGPSAAAWPAVPDLIRCQSAGDSGLSGRALEARFVVLYLSNDLASADGSEVYYSYVTVGTPYNLVNWLWFDEAGAPALTDAPRRLPDRFDCTSMSLAELEAAGQVRFLP